MAAKTEFEKLKAKIAKSLEAGRVVIVNDITAGIASSNVAVDVYFFDDECEDSIGIEKLKGGSLEKWLKAAEKRESKNNEIDAEFPVED